MSKRNVFISIYSYLVIDLVKKKKTNVLLSVYTSPNLALIIDWTMDTIFNHSSNNIIIIILKRRNEFVLFYDVKKRY